MIFRILIAFFPYPVNPVDPVKVLRSVLSISWAACWWGVCRLYLHEPAIYPGAGSYQKMGIGRPSQGGMPLRQPVLWPGHGRRGNLLCYGEETEKERKIKMGTLPRQKGSSLVGHLDRWKASLTSTRKKLWPFWKQAAGRTILRRNMERRLRIWAFSSKRRVFTWCNITCWISYGMALMINLP